MNTVIYGFGLAVIFGIITTLLFNKYHEALAMLCMSLSLICGIFATAMLAMILLTVPLRTNTFIRQKAYIESVDSDTFQSAGITLSKIEQNGWLYTAQFTRGRFGDWGPYPETVLDLEPIK